MVLECPMALDRPDDDGIGPRDVRPDRHFRVDDPSSDAPPARAEPAESRPREEYYEALRAADARSADELHTAPDARTDHCGWDTVDAENRPRLDAICVTPERTKHILDGDRTGGGHRHGVGNPGKTEFPASWADEKIINNVLDVACKPDKPPTHQDWNDTWLCTGTRDNVEVSAVVERSGDILTGWPEEGSPGVVRNPRKGNHDRN
jgi:hypothetical protein